MVTVFPVNPYGARTRAYAHAIRVNRKIRHEVSRASGNGPAGNHMEGTR